MSQRSLRITVLLLLAAHGVADAQLIRGTVVDENTTAPIVGAIVDVMQRDAVLGTARTDSAGGFFVTPRRTGRFEIRVSHPSYASVSSLELSLQSGETLTVELRMGRAAIALEPLVIRARTDARLSGFQERRRRGTGFGGFVTREEIDTRPGARTTDLLRLMPGVEIVTVPQGGEAGTPDFTAPRINLITMRAPAGLCMPAIFLDGMSVRQFRDSGIDELLKPELLEGVEVYPRSVGAPPEFADSDMCGVVAFWTRAGLGDGRGWSWVRAASGAAAFLFMVALTR